jgi:hypothetical protein
MVLPSTSFYRRSSIKPRYFSAASSARRWIKARIDVAVSNDFLPARSRILA